MPFGPATRLMVSRPFGEGAEHFDDAPEGAAAIAKDLHAGVCLLVKGSRTARMERVIEALKAGEND